MEIFLGAILIFCLRFIDVSMGTVRLLMAMRGRRLVAGLIGFIEVSIYIVAISQVSPISAIGGTFLATPGVLLWAPSSA